MRDKICLRPMFGRISPRSGRPRMLLGLLCAMSGDEKLDPEAVGPCCHCLFRVFGPLVSM
jgi:hypothetical protein